MELIIADVTIRQDEENRFCLNDLHKAAGGEEKHSPNRWTRTDGYQSLVAELTPEMAFVPALSVRGGAAPGTYVCKELVYAYAMWISPQFNLKVIRAYDQLMTQGIVMRQDVAQQAADDPATFLAKAVLVAQQQIEQQQAKVIALEHKVAEQAPKVEALERISASHTTMTMTQAAKVLSIKRDALTSFLQMQGWIYRQNGSWVAYAQHLKNGNLSYKEANYADEKSGLSCTKPYCHITQKGLTKLAMMLSSTPPANEPSTEDCA